MSLGEEIVQIKSYQSTHAIVRSHVVPAVHFSKLVFHNEWQCLIYEWFDTDIFQAMGFFRVQHELNTKDASLRICGASIIFFLHIILINNVTKM